MTRKLKALGLALFATLALGAIGAQGAMAEGELFHSNSEPTYLTGEQEHEKGQINRFILHDKNGNFVECTKATFEGKTAQKTVSKVTLEVEYHECGVNGAKNEDVTVNMNGCAYVLTSELKESTGGEKHAKVEIECPAEKHIEVIIQEGLCIVDVFPQKEEDLTHGAVYDNEVVEEEVLSAITGTVTVQSIHWEATKTFFCTVGGLGEHTGNNATYVSSVTLEGFSDEAHTKPTSIWWE